MSPCREAEMTPAAAVIVVAFGWSLVLSAPQVTPAIAADAAPGLNVLTFHGDPQRTGWNSMETILTPANVAGPDFGPLWNSPQFDLVHIGETDYAPHMYASPLYVDDVLISVGPYADRHFAVVVAATGNGFVYAVNAFATTGDPVVPAGTILWSTRLGTPSRGPDGGVPVGVLSTPTIDLNATPPRIYVTADTTEGGRSWKVFALDLTSGSVVVGWPLIIANSTLGPINQNGPTTFQSPGAMSQRGGLNLSPDGGVLYVPFGAYGDGGAGWMVAVDTAVDTATPSLTSAFAGAPSGTRAFANAGMWGSGGPAIDADGNVYATTGNGPSDTRDVAGYWGESLLVWGPGSPLQLIGTYTPWNYCQMDDADTDLGGDTPMILPDLDPSTTSTPHLVAFGSKQGTAYLVDRDNLPGRLDQRQSCNTTDSTVDGSLLGPDPQPPFGAVAPLSVFGPYSEIYTMSDNAKARTTPAYFQAGDGTNYVFYSGATKSCLSCREPVPPGLARLKVVLSPGAPAYLSIDKTDPTDPPDSGLSLFSPGSPVVTSNGSSNPIVWVLDANVYRSASLIGASVPHPVLYAVDGTTMHVLWHSAPTQLNVGGKYNHPTIARGVVFVGTDRIQAFGLPAPATPPTVYRLNAPSSFQRGCFAPCLCPVMLGAGLRGTLGLAPTGFDRLFDTYAVTDVNWTVTLGDRDLGVTGSGTYRVGGEFAVQQELALDLKVGDDPVQHFDSGLVPGGGQFPDLRIPVSIPGQGCFNTVVRVDASPVPTDQVDLRHGPLFTEFAVVNVDWLVAGAAGTPGVPVRGAGTYRVGGEFAAPPLTSPHARAIPGAAESGP